MVTVGYARVSSVGQSLDVQLEKLKGCDKVFKEKRSGLDTGRPALKQCLEFLRDGDTLLVERHSARTSDGWYCQSQGSRREVRSQARAH